MGRGEWGVGSDFHFPLLTPHSFRRIVSERHNPLIRDRNLQKTPLLVQPNIARSAAIYERHAPARNGATGDFHAFRAAAVKTHPLLSSGPRRDDDYLASMGSEPDKEKVVVNALIQKEGAVGEDEFAGGLTGTGLHEQAEPAGTPAAPETLDELRLLADVALVRHRAADGVGAQPHGRLAVADDTRACGLIDLTAGRLRPNDPERFPSHGSSGASDRERPLVDDGAGLRARGNAGENEKRTEEGGAGGKGGHRGIQYPPAQPAFENQVSAATVVRKTRSRMRA